MAGLISRAPESTQFRSGHHRGIRRAPLRARDWLLLFALADFAIVVACIVLGIAHG